MKKTAVVYDKWLDTLGGGEIVACNIVKILLDNNYNVTLACRKKVPIKTIKKKINIDISGVKFFEVWNDEDEIQKITEGKDLFINISFMDYSVGKAKRNIYYAHFPTPSYIGPISYLKNEIIFPKLAKFLKPVEFLDPPISKSVQDKHLSYLLGKKTSLAFSYLNKGSSYFLRFCLFHEPISKTSLEKVSFNLKHAIIKKQTITIDHQHSVVKYHLVVVPNKSSIVLFLKNRNKTNKIYLIEPLLDHFPFKIPLINILERILLPKIRAGIYRNIKTRINSFDAIIVHSQFVKKWVKKYWNKNALVIYPPVDLISNKNEIDYSKKKKVICSVGRFFTLGHSKRQDIMIEAFQKLCDNGLKNWQLHLAGGLGNEPSSIKYMEKLKKMARGYPIKFIINKPRKDIVDLFIKSKIYWHAAGYGQDENKNPINLEHFGITVVEAISAGCLPVIYHQGGLPEILNAVKLDPKQHTFSSISELVSKTRKIILQNNYGYQDPIQTNKLLKQNFSTQTFQKQIKNLLKITPTN